MFSDNNVATCWNRYRMNYIFARINTITVYLLGPEKQEYYHTTKLTGHWVRFNFVIINTLCLMWHVNFCN